VRQNVQRANDRDGAQRGSREDRSRAADFEMFLRAVLPADRYRIRSRKEAKRAPRAPVQTHSARSQVARAHTEGVLTDIRKPLAHRWRRRISEGCRNQLIQHAKRRGVKEPRASSGSPASGGYRS